MYSAILGFCDGLVDLGVEANDLAVELAEVEVEVEHPVEMVEERRRDFRMEGET